MTNGHDPITPQDEHKYFNRTDGEVTTLFNCGGLTKREYFAAMAMQGSIASDSEAGSLTVEGHAKLAARAADALIEALNKEAE